MDHGGPGRREDLQAAHGLAGVTGREVRRGRSMGSIGDGNPEVGKAAGDVVVQSWG